MSGWRGAQLATLIFSSLRFTHHGVHDGHKCKNYAATDAAACHLTNDRAEIEAADSFRGFRRNSSTGQCRCNLTAKAATNDTGRLVNSV
jgi:hypothetical protein